jgi:rhamnogalacturonan acetylesterase
MKKLKVLYILPIIAIVGLCAAFIPLSKPVFYLIGDSTVRNPNPPQCSWGQVIYHYFDTTRISISNQAIAGRSTRSFLREGRWQKVITAIKPGDYLLIEFGHNEGGKPDTGKTGMRAVLKNIGDDSVTVNYAKGPEVVHSYGWYLRKFSNEAKAKGATVIIASMIASNVYKEGKIARADKTYGLWASQIAKETGAYFLDANSIIADKFDKMGPELVKGLFPYDPVHTNVEGAGINAGSVVTAIKRDTSNTLNQYFAGKKF